MRLELTRVGLLVELANHYTTRGAISRGEIGGLFEVSLSKLCFQQVYPGNQKNTVVQVDSSKEEDAE